MMFKLLFLLLGILPLALGYGVKEPVATGEFSYLNISTFGSRTFFFANNADSFYGVLGFQENSTAFLDFSLGPDEIVTADIPLPPACVYYGFTLYLYNQTIDGVTTQVFASMTDTLNMVTLQRQCTRASSSVRLVISPNQDLLNASMVEYKHSNECVQPLAVPGALVDLKTARFIVLIRFTKFYNQDAGNTYLDTVQAKVVKWRATEEPKPNLFGYPNWIPRPQFGSEDFLSSDLKLLLNQVRDYYQGFALQSLTVSEPYLANVSFQNGFSCFNNSINCYGDNPDALYVVNGPFEQDTSTFFVVVGVNHAHVSTSLEEDILYNSLQIYDNENLKSMGDLFDTDLVGSASMFLPASNPNADKLYVAQFGRSCVGSPVPCMNYTLPVMVDIVERIYVQQPYNVGPSNQTMHPFYVYKFSNRYSETK